MKKRVLKETFQNTIKLRNAALYYDIDKLVMTTRVPCKPSTIPSLYFYLITCNISVLLIRTLIGIFVCPMLILPPKYVIVRTFYFLGMQFNDSQILSSYNGVPKKNCMIIVTSIKAFLIDSLSNRTCSQDAIHEVEELIANLYKNPRFKRFLFFQIA